MAARPVLADLCRTCASPTQSGSRKAIFEGEGLTLEIPSKLKSLALAVQCGDALPQVVCDACVGTLSLVSKFIARARLADEQLRRMLGSATEEQGCAHSDQSETEKDEESSEAIYGFASHFLCLTHEGNREMVSKPLSTVIPPSTQTIKDPLQEVLDSFVCSVCNSSFPSLESMKSHVLNSHEICTSKKSEQETVPSKTIKSNLADSRSGKGRDCGFHGCDACRIVFPRRECLVRHWEGHRTECKVCSLRFPSVCELQAHLGQGHLESELTVWRCSECGTEVQGRSSVLSHVRVHTSARPFQCPECTKCFTKKQVLVTHLRLHAKDWRYVCSVCGKGFVAKGNYDYHMIASHSSEKPFKCHLCDRAYVQKDPLRRHLAFKHSIGERPTFLCDLCGKSYNDKQNLCFHVETHFKSLEERKKHGCVVCGARFIKSSGLKRHMVIHTGERGEKKYFECPLCRKKLLSSNSLKSHLVLHSGVKSFVCETCGKAFATAKTLKGHVDSHTGERRHQCHLCGASFTQRSPLVTHLMKKHGIDGRVRQLPKPPP